MAMKVTDKDPFSLNTPGEVEAIVAFPLATWYNIDTVADAHCQFTAVGGLQRVAQGAEIGLERFQGSRGESRFLEARKVWLLTHKKMQELRHMRRGRAYVPADQRKGFPGI